MHIYMYIFWWIINTSYIPSAYRYIQWATLSTISCITSLKLSPRILWDGNIYNGLSFPIFSLYTVYYSKLDSVVPNLVHDFGQVYVLEGSSICYFLSFYLAIKEGWCNFYTCYLTLVIVLASLSSFSFYN